MKNLMITALLLSGTGFAFPPLPEILNSQPECRFAGSDNFGVCYKNNTPDEISEINVTVKTFMNDGKQSYTAEYEPIPSGKYAVFAASTKHLTENGVSFALYSLSIADQLVCPPIGLQKMEMSKPVELVISKTGDNYQCWASN